MKTEYIKNFTKCSLLNMKITVLIVVKNEENNIKGCLESVKWADEIIIVDSDSTDRTTEIAGVYTKKIFKTSETDVTEKRIFALSKTDVSNEWVLFLDADERITEKLAEEILSLKDDSSIDGYFINRRNYYLGKWIQHSGIYPDYTLRLFRKNRGKVTNRIIHEAIEIDGDTAMLKNDMLHYSYRDLEQMMNKINYFSTLEAKEHLNNKKKITKAGVYTHALSSFLRVFISRKGYKDGLHGFYVGFCYTAVNFLSHLKLLKLQNKI